MTGYDVVVCGAGVGGLTTARALGRNGIRVLVVDKQARSAEPYKGEVLQPHSLLVLDALGLLRRAVDESALVTRLVCAQPSGATICTLDYGMLAPPYDHCRVNYYPGIIDLLESGMPPSVEVRRGVAVKDLLSRDDRVSGVRLAHGRGTEEVDARLVVAADGHSSSLRTGAGIAIEAQRYPHQVVAFDLAAPDLAPEAVTYVTRHGIRLLYPMPGGRARFYAQVPQGSVNRIGRAGLPGWLDWMLTTVPDLARLAEPLRDGLADARTLSARRFLAPVWQRPGLVLVGDAAHAVHPMAGQGMNAAIADGHSLAAALADVDLARPSDVDAAVAGHVTRRRTEMEFVGRFSHNFAGLFTSTGRRDQLLAQHVLRRHGTNRRLSFKVMYNLSGLGVLRFSRLDRLQQMGLFDPRSRTLPAVRPPRAPRRTEFGVLP